jgi:hypothetical protein
MRVLWPAAYGRPNAGGWANPILAGIATHARVEHLDIPQPQGNVVLFHVAVGTSHARVVLDYDDKRELKGTPRMADLYFKMQYDRDGYEDASVVPGGYISKKTALYRYTQRWRELRNRSAPSIDVLGRFGLNWNRDIRTQALAMLHAQHRFTFKGGGSPVWWGEHMEEICNARICLDLPGNGDFCYRLVEYLATGACVVGPEPKTEMHVPLKSGVHLVRVPRSLDGLIDWCERLVNDDDLRASIAQNAADYFDRYLALDQLGAYYVDRIWHCLNDG